MKKILALLLALLMTVSLLACGSKDSAGSASPSSAPSESKAPASAGSPASNAPSGAQYPKEAGYFDPEFDYTQFKEFKVSYLSSAPNFLTAEFDVAYADWAKRINVKYTGLWSPSSNSADEYLSGIQTFIDQGYDGLIFDPDIALYPRIVEIMSDSGCKWVSGLGQARDYSGDNRLYQPTVGFDFIQDGVDLMDKLVEWKEETWPNVPWEKVGVIHVDLALAPEVHQRQLGSEMEWARLHPEFGEYDPSVTKNPKNYFPVDTTTGNMDQATAQNLVMQIISNPGDIEVWLIPTAVDDYCMGAANAVTNLGLTERACTVCCGGSNLPIQFDNGQFDAWRYAKFTAQSIFAEPIICQLWAYMSGQTTPDAIWPEWVNVNDKGDKKDDAGKVVEEHFYASVKLPSAWIDKDNYKVYLEWTDLYAYGPDVEGHYKYEPVSDLNLFSARSTPPPEHKIPAS